MAHHKSSNPNRATSKSVKCSACGKPGQKHKMKREPPGHGPWVHEGACRDEARAKGGGRG